MVVQIGPVPATNEQSQVKQNLAIQQLFSATVDNTAAIAAIPAGVTLASPTASVGTSVVNGSAATAMRSDAAPPIALNIVPVWTGLHTFTTEIDIKGSSSGTFTEVVASDGSSATMSSMLYTDNDLLVQRNNISLPANYCMQVVEYYEISAANSFEIATGAIFFIDA